MLALSLLAWLGQTIVLLFPATAARWGLCESEDQVETAFWADVRGEALWDALTLWTLVVAAVLLIMDLAAWAYFGLIGGGMYVYFAGRGIATRVVMRKHALRIGSASGVKTAFVFLALWLLTGVATIGAAATALVDLAR
jgi:hypothetical protein